MKPVSCSIFFHNYYGGHDQWLEVFKIIPVPFNLYYNVVTESIYNYSITPGELELLFQTGNMPNLQGIKVFFSSNKGKDIGGKMIMMNACLLHNDNAPFIVFLHDKKSPYSIRGNAWRNKLFRIIEPAVLQNAIEVLTKNERIGIVAAKEFVACAHGENKKFAGINAPLIEQLMVQYGIKENVYEYIAGTMFIAKAAPLQKFFSAQHPLAIRATLEEGNIMDDEQPSYTHSWERILPWLVTSAGYSIMGV